MTGGLLEIRIIMKKMKLIIRKRFKFEAYILRMIIIYSVISTKLDFKILYLEHYLVKNQLSMKKSILWITLNHSFLFHFILSQTYIDLR